MKQVILILCALMIGSSLPSLAQARGGSAVSPEYTLSAVVSNVEFYQAMTQCNGKNVVLLKFINQNDHNVEVTWKELFVTAQVSKESEGFRNNKLMLTPGTTAPSGCKDVIRKELVVSCDKVNPSYAADILKFKFADIHVTTLK